MLIICRCRCTSYEYIYIFSFSHSLSLSLSLSSPLPSFALSRAHTLAFITAVTSTIPQPGDQVLLYCNYTGAQGVSWTKGTMIISPTLFSNPCSCVSSAIDNSNSSLAINVTYGDDYGSYTCSVQIGFGTSCPTSIVVQRPSEFRMCVCVYVCV